MSTWIKRKGDNRWSHHSKISCSFSYLAKQTSSWTSAAAAAAAAAAMISGHYLTRPNLALVLFGGSLTYRTGCIHTIFDDPQSMKL
jgi:hypothetical protein